MLDWANGQGEQIKLYKYLNGVIRTNMASLLRFIIIHAHGRKATNHDLSPLAFSYVFDRVFFTP